MGTLIDFVCTAKEKRKQEKEAVLFERMQFLTERGLEALGLVPFATHKPFLEPLRSFFPLKTC